MEPTSFTVKEDSQFKGGETEFVKTKLMTRLTYTLDEVRACCSSTQCAQKGRIRVHAVNPRAVRTSMQVFTRVCQRHAESTR